MSFLEKIKDLWIKFETKVYDWGMVRLTEDIDYETPEEKSPSAAESAAVIDGDEQQLDAEIIIPDSPIIPAVGWAEIGGDVLQ